MPGVDLPLRKLAAIEALSRAGKATPSMLGSIIIEPESVAGFRGDRLVEHPARARTTFPIARKRLDEAEQIIRARLNSQGTAMHLSSDPRRSFWWLMVSPARATWRA